MTPTPEPTAQPTLEQMRIEVCEKLIGWVFIWCGERNVFDVYRPEPNGSYAGSFSTKEKAASECLPALTLDWLHEAVGKLESRHWAKFLRELAIATRTDLENNSLFAVMAQTNATAPQRLLALWRTIKNV